jgi:hypothetical protein
MFVVLLPTGAYETKVAIDQSWTENYGLGGVPDGANIGFGVSGGSLGTQFSYNSGTHVLTVDDLSPTQVPEPASVLLVGSGLSLVTRRIAQHRKRR